MKIILHDIKLCQFLHKLIKFNKNRQISNQSNDCVTSRPTAVNRCNKCILCVLEENIKKISQLICNILKLNIKNLLIYLKLDQSHFLQSTITLNYIKTLYSSILTHYISSFKKMDIMNNEKLDVIIIPIYKIQEKEIKIIDFNSVNGDSDDINTFIYINNQFLYYPFYSNYSTQYTQPNQPDEPNVPNEPCELNELYDVMNICHDGMNNSDLWIKKYHNIMFCGTFDYLHFGHKLLLLAACLSCSNKLSIGVSTGDLLKNKQNSHKIQHISKRIHYLNYYLQLLIKYINTNNTNNTMDTINTNNTVDTVDIDEKVEKNSTFNDDCDILNYNIEFNILDDEIEENNVLTTVNQIGEKIIVNLEEKKINPKVDRVSENKFSHLNCCSQIINTITTTTSNTTTNTTTNTINTNNIITTNNIGMINLEIFELEDVIGPSCEIKEKFGLLVTPEIMSNGVKVNQQRSELGLIQWDLITIGLVCYYHNHNYTKLSSNTIRNL